VLNGITVGVSVSIPGRFTEDIKEQVRHATDVVDLVSQYVTLKTTGKHFKGLCPFHDDKTPSFIVTPERQTYHCFACKAGGDVFTFVMEQEKLDFPAALEFLARRAGITLPARGREGKSPSYDRNRLYEVNEWAAKYFVSLLSSNAGDSVRNYLSNRRFTEETISSWQLGFSSDSWDGLLKAGQRAGYRASELEKAGLVLAREGSKGYYDRFRNRLMFPIFDIQNRVIGFGARKLREKDQPKYLNSPETPLFSKGRALYGLNKAKKAAGENGSIAIVEGYTDVLMAHQNGVTNVVATLGTALTRDHVKLLKRFAPQVVVVFDADPAGQKASDRSLDIFVEESMEVNFAELPPGEDPCDTLSSVGPDGFRKLLNQGEELFAYRVRLARKTSSNTPAAQAEAVDRILETVGRIPNGVERALVLDRVVKLVAETFDTNDERALRRRLQNRMKRLNTRPELDSRHRRNNDVQSPLPPVEREVLSIGLLCPELVEEIEKSVRPEDFSDPRSSAIFAAMLHVQRSGTAVEPSRIASFLEDKELSRLLVEITTVDAEKGNFRTRLKLCLERWEQDRKRASARSLRAQLKAAASSGDTEAERKLWRDFTNRL